MASAFWLELAGAGIADGKTSILQTKNYIVMKNGTYVFTPDEGYDGFKSVGLDAEIPSLDTSDGTLEPQKMLAGTIGYSQNERMVGTIPTYDGATMNLVAKGDIITIEGKQYRVLNTNGAVAEVLGLYSASYLRYDSTGTTVVFTGGASGLQYRGSTLDVYLNETFFATLSATMQAAIVPKAISQDMWNESSTAPSSGTYYRQTGNFAERYYFDNAGDVSYGTAEVGSRNVYALSVREVIDYLGVSANGDFTDTDIRKMLDVAAKPRATWLRTSSADGGANGMKVEGNYAYMQEYYCLYSESVSPAFQIDLSKIAWSK